jgi:tRNA pseudouridine13 synthase
VPYTKLPDWPTVYGGPCANGEIRIFPEDFVVEEQLSFEASGTGEHAFLYIQKTGENTEYVARMLARFAGVRQRDISFAGLKDRHAVTSQWFSVWLPGKPDPDWSQFESDSIKVLQAIRHARKLKRGVLSGNRFKLTIRNWRGDSLKTVEQLQTIKDHGIANYFGSQRFGNQGQNVNKALAMFQGAKVGREQRSLYLSSARSFLFNNILGFRVSQQLWNQAVAGDVFSFDGSHTIFKSEQPDDEIQHRLQAGLIHPTGALWGRGESGVSLDTLAIEQEIIASHTELAQGLIDCQVDQDRRALRVNVPDLQWQFIEDDVLVLEFTLPAGSYATALLREIVRL